MKNQEFYKIVSKTKLLKVFENNRVMYNTYFGEGGPTPTGLSLNFKTQAVYDMLLGAEPWDASAEHTPYTLYRRANQFTADLEDDGTKLYTEKTSSAYRYGLVTTFDNQNSGTWTYKCKFKLEVPEDYYEEGGNRTLLAFFVSDNTSEISRVQYIREVNTTNDHIELRVAQGGSASTVATIPVTNKNEFMELAITINIDEHKVTYLINGRVCYEGDITADGFAFVNIAGASTAGFKDKTALTVDTISFEAE